MRTIKWLAAAAAVLGVASAVQAQMSLPGSFEVSETGAAVYTIPIAVPPGTAGLEPKLTLQYNSRAGNGLLGVGWTLGGLPSIVRCPKSIAQDGARGGVTYDANDRFCLEGERLIAITGTYGADGTEYRTEREGFSKIVSYGSAGTGPAWFKVWTKAGQVLEFGNTTDSRIEAQGKTTARLWAVNKVSDTAGNYFAVTYAEDSTNGEYRPTRIDYTGNTSASVSPYASVRFAYESRPTVDAAPHYHANSVIRTTYRLTNVQTFIGESLARDHRLAYELSASTQRSRLVSLALCDTSAACLPPTTFAWQDMSPSLPSASVWSSAFSSAAFPNSGGFQRLLGDANGDGRADIFAFNNAGTNIALSTGTAFGASSVWMSLAFGNNAGQYTDLSLYPRLLADANGDGMTDIIGPYTGGTNVAVSTGSSYIWALPGENLWAYDWGTYGGYDNMNYAPRMMADANGDGRADIFGFSSPGTRVGLSTGTSFSAGTVWTVSFGNNTAQYTDESLYPRLLGDVNGDGLVDIVGPYTGGTNVAVNTGSSFVWALPGENLWAYDWGTYSGYDNVSVHPRMLADVNGDGLADIVGFKADGVYVGLSTGVSFTAASRWLANFGTSHGYTNQGSHPRTTADMNGDGRADIVAFAADGVYVALSEGAGFAAPVRWIADFGANAGYTDQMPRMVADVDGDGRPDIVAFGSSNVMVSVTGGQPMPDLLQAVNGGLSATSLAYASLSTAGAPYIKDTGAGACAYPCVDVQGPVYVVNEVQTANGIGGTYRTTYRYAGAKADQHGRGFLGFRQVIAKDEQTLVEQATEYLQSWPFVGLTAKRTKTLGAVELNRTENTYASDDLGSGRKFVKLTQSVESSKELAGTALPTVTTTYQYDSYGNATNVAVSTGDGHSKTTVNTYTNDLTNWLLGRLTRAEVTSVTP